MDKINLTPNENLEPCSTVLTLAQQLTHLITGQPS